MQFSFDLLATPKSLPAVYQYAFYQDVSVLEASLDAGIKQLHIQKVPETIYKVHPFSGSNQQTAWERGVEFHLS